MAGFIGLTTYEVKGRGRQKGIVLSYGQVSTGLTFFPKQNSSLSWMIRMSRK